MIYAAFHFFSCHGDTSPASTCSNTKASIGMSNSYGGLLAFQFFGDLFITVNLFAKVKGKKIFMLLFMSFQ